METEYIAILKTLLHICICCVAVTELCYFKTTSEFIQFEEQTRTIDEITQTACLNLTATRNDEIQWKIETSEK